MILIIVGSEINAQVNGCNWYIRTISRICFNFAADFPRNNASNYVFVIYELVVELTVVYVIVMVCEYADNHDIISMKLYDIGVVRKVSSVSMFYKPVAHT